MRLQRCLSSHKISGCLFRAKVTFLAAERFWVEGAFLVLEFFFCIEADGVHAGERSAEFLYARRDRLWSESSGKAGRNVQVFLDGQVPAE